MPTTRMKISKEELDKGTIPVNQILIRMTYSSEGRKTKSGIIVGFETDTQFVDDTGHAADLAEVSGIVYKLPEQLYFNENDESGMNWDCDIDLQVGDEVWFSQFESKNSTEVECEDIVYKFIPYADCFVAKRDKKIFTLNGYVLCEPIYQEQISTLDPLSKDKIDMTRGIVRYLGKPNRQYLRPQYVDMIDLKEGDLVQFEANTPLFLLERNRYLSLFNDNKLYWVVQRRRIALILKRE